MMISLTPNYNREEELIQQYRVYMVRAIETGHLGSEKKKQGENW